MAVPKFFDLSHTIRDGMSYFPGDPEPAFKKAHEALPPWRVTEMRIGSHTGTHIDAASHYIEHGLTIDQYPLERFVLPGICVPAKGLAADQPIPGQIFERHYSKIPKGGAVLVMTGWDRYWGEEQYIHHPYLSAETAERIKAAGAGLVGIDALNVDATAIGTEHVHQILLGGDILIVENLRGLEQLEPAIEYFFSFLPLKLFEVDGSPIRAAAWR